jgi:hypothetical protein
MDSMSEEHQEIFDFRKSKDRFLVVLSWSLKPKMVTVTLGLMQF